ncbi:MAG TPA: nucleotide excision repair endonuclease, partial [Acidimicrobiia bacterium]|nr:nucleotide excision repair endonuclease [Acidimicrobiia bacterium]
MNALSAAASDAPNLPGVYFLLGADTELLYVGKASNLRSRIRQHAAAKPGAGGLRLDMLYQHVSEVRWVVLADEPAAATHEADLIVALRPAFNASHTNEGRWNYILVEYLDRADRSTRFTLSKTESAESGHRYGCFAHLGRGVSSPPAIACSDGYTATLRLLWTASSHRRSQFPAKITRSAPDTFTVPVPAHLSESLHAFFSGTSSRLLDALPTTNGRDGAYLSRALARDRIIAEGFFRHGPRALRQLRLRHRQPRGAMTRRQVEACLAADLQASIGPFRLPRPRDP